MSDNNQGGGLPGTAGSILFDARPIQVLTLYGILHQPKSET